jgi:hypothetical protein
MTNEELQAIKERCEKATPGPWSISILDGVSYSMTDDAGRSFTQHWKAYYMSPDNYKLVALDAEFIAHAREDVPALLAEIERLEQLFLRARFTCEACGEVSFSYPYCPECQGVLIK